MLVCVSFPFMFIVEHIVFSGLEHYFVKGPSAKTVVSVRYTAEKFMPHSYPSHEATKYLQQGNWGKNGLYEGFLVDYSLHIRNLFPQVKFSALNQQM